MILLAIAHIEKLVALAGKPFYCIVYACRDDISLWIRLMRKLCSLLIGFLMAYWMWTLLGFRAIFGQVHWTVLVTFVLSIGIAYMLSVNMRSVILLIFAGLLSNAGRSYLRAICFALVISGPIDNLVRNAGEVARVFACTTVLTYNLTKTRFDLMAKPFTNTLQTMKDDLDEIQGNFKELQNILADLKYGVEYTNIEDEKFGYAKRRRAANASSGSFNSSAELPTASKVQSQFLHNMRNRCKHQLRSGHRVCEEVFLEGYRKCGTNFPEWLASVICWPYRVDIICRVNMFGNPDKVCDASKVVPADFGETYVKLLSTEHELFDNSSNIEITYQMQNITTSEQLLSAKETSEQFLEDFESRRQTFNFVMRIMEKAMYLFVLCVIYSSINYLYNYRTHVDFDNVYITHYFKHLNARRCSIKKPTVLPLRSFERPLFVDVDLVNSRTEEENKAQTDHLLQLALELVTTGVFLLLDHLVVNLLLIIHQRSLITYTQEGEHEVRFRINGTGLMARLLRTTMKNFNIHERISTSLSNEECLPVPHVLPTSFYINLLLIYLLIIFLIYQSTSFMRLRRVICSYFFYKREKERILFLYISMLRNRHTYMELMRQRAEENLAERHFAGKLNLCLHLRLRYPQTFGWLGEYKCARRRCLTCNELEDDKFVFCISCSLAYCHDCIGELNAVCLFCGEPLSTSSAHPADKARHSDDTSVDVFTYRKKK